MSAMQRDCETCAHVGAGKICMARPGCVTYEYERWTPRADAPAADQAPPGEAIEPGRKDDTGKHRAGLVLGDFARALTEVSRVGSWALGKYPPGNWIKVPDGVDRYTDALWRHLLAEASGERLDPESELAHAAHTCWNALARLDLMLRAQDEGKEA